MTALNESQVRALWAVERGFVTSFNGRSIPSLVKRGLVTDHGRYWQSRGHADRYELSETGRAAVSELPR